VKGKKIRILYKGNIFAFFKQNNYKGKNDIKKKKPKCRFSRYVYGLGFKTMQKKKKPYSIFVKSNNNMEFKRWEDNISIKSLTKKSFKKILTMNFIVSKPWKIFHSSKSFFTQNSTCLLTLQLPLFTFSSFFSSINKKTFWNKCNTKLSRHASVNIS